MSKILVFGSTGNIGFEVASSLAKKNVPFRAVVHSIEKADKVKSLGSNIEVVQVDIHNPESLAKSLVGIEKVFFMTPPGQTITGGVKMADAVKKAGVKHVVKLSGLGIEEKGGKFLWAEEHQVVEDQLNKDGIPLTSLRPASFFSNIIGYDAQGIKHYNSISKLGDPRLNYISNKDIGEAAAVALTQDGHEGKIYNLTGPETLTYSQVTKKLSDVIGKQVNFTALDETGYRAKMAPFLPPFMMDGYINMVTYFKNGGYDKEFGDLEKLLGHKGTTIEQFFQENKQAFL